ncbi:myomegalin-like isoform X2 [Moschus berezovskii]|uniref:myomegalin-like isoform X2 n=1 Tax=Moschus berezovskii TaxID=68408 RepID=UPI00244470BD|nr:myomegalin-like isoform X2 [Moschus berezovskii]
MGSEGIQELRSSATALHHRLEESASLLTMFWRAALLSSPGPALVGKVPEPQDKEPNRRRKEHRGGRDMRTMGESMKKELLELRTKLSKQESLLQSTSERLKTANQQKESMEQFIFSQLTRTHDVLKKARTNLEVRNPLHRSEQTVTVCIRMHR